ncbi:PREDICTED: uncharacterized protein LOC104609090 [Nelumbo nucifera]|uniref:Uncharacterized protein LOC104609090 n=1 Tax=Nelumbo nucifera TaxID=4432 RepID=A0A1U8AZB9_NELNU|nr:PREDICTED: uncharacterized protein LOC104609090 [Nelumbo nucifera]
MISKFINATEARFQEQDKRILSHEASIKNLEVQVGQIVSMLSERKEEWLPSNTEKNPREQANAITLRSGKTIGEIQREDKGAEVVDLQKENEGSTPKLNLHEIKLPIPYPRRVLKAKLDKQFEKFLEVFKKIHINLPLLDVLSQMPKYAKFLKEVMFNKRKWEDGEMVKLNEECLAILQKKLPSKLKDPESFSIPCTMGNTEFEKALSDRSIKYPRGIVEDVLVKVGNFIILADFIVLDMEEDNTMLLILGRPFLATIGHEIYAIDCIDGVDTSKSEDTLKVALNNSPNQLQQAEQKFVLKAELRNLTSELDSFEIATHNASFINLPPSHTKPLPSIVQAPFLGLNPPMKDERGKHRKLKTKWSRPFEVARVFPHEAIELHNDDGKTFKDFNEAFREVLLNLSLLVLVMHIEDNRLVFE